MSLKLFLGQVALFVCIISVLGHFSVNLWERLVLHSELNQMKSSLGNLKVTLNTIECAYENLQNDVTYLADMTEEYPTTEIYKHMLQLDRVIDPGVSSPRRTSIDMEPVINAIFSTTPNKIRRHRPGVKKFKKNMNISVKERP